MDASCSRSLPTCLPPTIKRLLSESNTSFEYIFGRRSFTLIKFKSQIISFGSLNMGVADKNKSRRLSACLTRANKYAASLLFDFKL